MKIHTAARRDDGARLAAATAFATAARLKPNAARVRAQLGILHGEAGKHVRAVEELSVAVALLPSNASYRCNLAAAFHGVDAKYEAETQQAASRELSSP